MADRKPEDFHNIAVAGPVATHPGGLDDGRLRRDYGAGGGGARSLGCARRGVARAGGRVRKARGGARCAPARVVAAPGRTLIRHEP